MLVVDERGVRGLDQPVPLNVDVVEAVDHHLRHRVVREKRLDRSVAECVGGDLVDQPLTINRRERCVVTGELRSHHLPDTLAQVGGLLVREEPGPELRDARTLHAHLEVAVRVDHAGRRAALLVEQRHLGRLFCSDALSQPSAVRSALVSAELVFEVHAVLPSRARRRPSQRRRGAATEGERAAFGAVSDSAIVPIARENSESASPSTTANPRLTAGATAASLGISNATSTPRASSTCSFVSPTLEETRLSTRLRREGGKPSWSSVRRLSLTFFRVGTSSPQSRSSWSVGCSRASIGP